MKLSFLIILIFISLNGYSQFGQFLYTDIDFKENQADTINIKLDSILILGIGSSVTRIFLDDLSAKIIEELKTQDIIASYSYLGKNRDEANKQFRLMNKGGYKAILVFLPKDTALFETKNFRSTNTTHGDYGPIQTTRTYSRLSYQQSFNFQFYKTGKVMQRFWNALVDIDCDPGKKYATKKLANKLLNRLKNNKYIK